MKNLIATVLLCTIIFTNYALSQIYCDAVPFNFTPTDHSAQVCNQYDVEYFTQQNWVSMMPELEVRVIFHFMPDDANVRGTFKCGGANVPDEQNAIYIVSVLMGLINDLLSNPVAEVVDNEPTGNHIPDTKLRFVLHESFRNNCQYSGIYIYSPGEQFQIIPDALNIRVKELAKSSPDTCRIGGSGSTTLLNRIWIENMYSLINNCNLTGFGELWSYDGLVIHELMHNMGLSHAWNCENECKGKDLNPNIHCQPNGTACVTGGVPDTSVCAYWKYQNNNIMGYGEQHALTFCQIQTAITNFYRFNSLYPFIKPKKQNDNLIVISGKQNWNRGRIILNDIVVPSGASLRMCGTFYFGENVRILVKQGGRLYVEGAILKSLSSNKIGWKGIEVEGNPNLTQPDPNIYVNFDTSPIQQPIEAGMAFIIAGSRISGTITTSVKNYRYDDRSKQPFPPVFPIINNTGGLIYATSSIFDIGKGRGIQLIDYSFPDKSVIVGNVFLGKSYSEGIGIHLLNMNTLEIEQNHFRNLSVGVNVADSGVKIKGGTLPNLISGTTDHFQKCDVGVYRSTVRDFRKREMLVEGVMFSENLKAIHAVGGFNAPAIVKGSRINKSKTGIKLDGGVNAEINGNVIENSLDIGVHSSETSNSTQVLVTCNQLIANPHALETTGENTRFKFERNLFQGNNINGYFIGRNGLFPIASVQSFAGGPASNCFDFTDDPDFIFDTIYTFKYIVKSGSNTIPVNPPLSCFQRPFSARLNPDIGDPSIFVVEEVPGQFSDCALNITVPLAPSEDPAITRNKIANTSEIGEKSKLVNEKNANLILLMYDQLESNSLSAALGLLENDIDFGARKLRHQAFLSKNHQNSLSFLNQNFNLTDPAESTYLQSYQAIQNYDPVRFIQEPDSLMIEQLKLLSSSGNSQAYSAQAVLNYITGEPFLINFASDRSSNSELKKDQVEVRLQTRVNIYPNPANGLLNIDLNTGNGKMEIVRVYNISGRLIESFIIRPGSLDSFQLSTQNYEKGVYFIGVQLSDGNVIFEKFVVNR